MVGLYDIQSFFAVWYNNLIWLWNFLIAPNFADYLYNSAEVLVGSTDTSWFTINLLRGFSGIVTLVFGNEASLLYILLGSSFAIFISKTLISWILRIVV